LWTLEVLAIFMKIISPTFKACITEPLKWFWANSILLQWTYGASHVLF
jgi:hypothetical protein